MRSSRRSNAIAIAVAISVSGCSFAFVRGPSDTPQPYAYPRCTESRTYPYVDAAIAALSLLGIVMSSVARDTSTTTSDPEERKAEIASSVIMTSAFGASAWYGFGTTSKCERARDAFRAQYPYGNQPYQYPQPYPYPPQPYPPQQPYPPPQPQQPAPQPYPPPPAPAPQ